MESRQTEHERTSRAQLEELVKNYGLLQEILARYTKIISLPWRDRRIYTKVLLPDFSRRIENNVPDRTSLAATITEMLDNGFIKSYDELYAVLFDRPSQAIKGDNLHSNDEGSSSHSKAPHRLFSDGSVVDWEPTGIRASVVNDPVLNNKVSIDDIPECGKSAFDDSDGSCLQMKELISAGSNGLHVDGINSPPGRFVSLDIPSVVNQQQREEYLGGELDRKKWGCNCISGGSNWRRDDGINSPLGQHVSIDIQSVVNQQWKEYIGNELDRNKRDYSLITTLALAIIVANATTLLNTAYSNAISGSSHTSWIVNYVAVATVIVFAFTMASIGLRRVKPMLSGIMIKLGTISAASAIILAFGSTLPPAVAWPAGAVACLIISIGVAMA